MKIIDDVGRGTWDVERRAKDGHDASSVVYRPSSIVYRLTHILIIISVAALISCAGSAVDEGENYGNLLDSPNGLILVEEEHGDGWARSDCSMCHHIDNIHLVNRTGLAIDITAIREEAKQNGDAGCPDCHGTNGVE